MFRRRVEADWEIEIGQGAPVIDASWQGFVDLGLFPEEAAGLGEVQEQPCLGDVLVRLNARESPVFTAKCDLWPIESADPFEFDSDAEKAACGFASYIDLLPHGPGGWTDMDTALAWSKSVCRAIRLSPLRDCRVDLILREANGVACPVAVTAYVAACGVSIGQSKLQLGAALAAFADVVTGAESAGTS